MRTAAGVAAGGPCARSAAAESVHAEDVVNVYVGNCKALHVKINAGLLAQISAIATEPVVDLTRNYIGGPTLQAITAVVARNEKLEVLRIPGSGLNNDSVIFLARALHSHPRIRELDLRSNGISLPSGLALLSLAKLNGQIVKIDLQGTQVDAAVIAKIERQLESNRMRPSPVESGGHIPLTASGHGLLADPEPTSAATTNVAAVAPARTPLQCALDECKPAQAARKERLRARASNRERTARESVLGLVSQMPIAVPRVDAFSGWTVVEVCVMAPPGIFECECDLLEASVLPRLNAAFVASRVHFTLLRGSPAGPCNAPAGETRLVVPEDTLRDVRRSRVIAVEFFGDRSGPISIPRNVDGPQSPISVGACHSGEIRHRASQPLQGPTGRRDQRLRSHSGRLRSTVSAAFRPVLHEAHELALEVGSCVILAVRQPVKAMRVPPSLTPLLSDDPALAHPSAGMTAGTVSVVSNAMGTAVQALPLSTEVEGALWAAHERFRTAAVKSIRRPLVIDNYVAHFDRCDPKTGRIVLKDLEALEEGLHARLLSAAEAIFGRGRSNSDSGKLMAITLSSESRVLSAAASAAGSCHALPAPAQGDVNSGLMRVGNLGPQISLTTSSTGSVATHRRAVQELKKPVGGAVGGGSELAAECADVYHAFEGDRAQVLYLMMRQTHQVYQAAFTTMCRQLCGDRTARRGKMDLYVVAPSSRNALLVHGQECSSMTTSLAAFAARLKEKQPTATVAAHFPRVPHIMEEPNDLRSMLLHLVEQLASSPDDLEYAHSEVDVGRLQTFFVKLLARQPPPPTESTAGRAANTAQPVTIVIIDGVDDLQPPVQPCAALRQSVGGGEDMWSSSPAVAPAGATSKSHAFIPVCLPRHVRMVLGCASSAAIMAELETRGRDSIEVQALSDIEQGTPEVLLLAALNRTVSPLTPEEIAVVCGKADGNNAEYVEFVLDAVCQEDFKGGARSTDRLSLLAALPDTLGEFLAQLLARLNITFGKAQTRTVLGLLCVSRWGLLELELRELLRWPSTTLNSFVRMLKPVLQRVPDEMMGSLSGNGLHSLVCLRSRAFRQLVENACSSDAAGTIPPWLASLDGDDGAGVRLGDAEDDSPVDADAEPKGAAAARQQDWRHPYHMTLAHYYRRIIFCDPAAPNRLPSMAPAHELPSGSPPLAYLNGVCPPMLAHPLTRHALKELPYHLGQARLWSYLDEVVVSPTYLLNVLYHRLAYAFLRDMTAVYNTQDAAMAVRQSRFELEEKAKKQKYERDLIKKRTVAAVAAAAAAAALVGGNAPTDGGRGKCPTRAPSPRSDLRNVAGNEINSGCNADTAAAVAELAVRRARLARLKEYIYFVRDHGADLSRHPHLLFQLAIARESRTARFRAEATPGSLTASSPAVSFLRQDVEKIIGRVLIPTCPRDPYGAFALHGHAVGRLMLVVSNRATVGKAVAHRSRVGHCIFAPNGQSLATGGDDSSVFVSSVLGESLFHLRQPVSQILSLAFSASSRYLLIVTQSRAVVVLDTSNGKIVSKSSTTEQTQSTRAFVGAALSHLGRYYVTLNVQGDVQVRTSERSTVFAHTSLPMVLSRCHQATTPIVNLEQFPPVCGPTGDASPSPALAPVPLAPPSALASPNTLTTAWNGQLVTTPACVARVVPHPTAEDEYFVSVGRFLLRQKLNRILPCEGPCDTILALPTHPTRPVVSFCVTGRSTGPSPAPLVWVPMKASAALSSRSVSPVTPSDGARSTPARKGTQHEQLFLIACVRGGDGIRLGPSSAASECSGEPAVIHIWDAASGKHRAALLTPSEFRSTPAIWFDGNTVGVGPNSIGGQTADSLEAAAAKQGERLEERLQMGPLFLCLSPNKHLLAVAWSGGAIVVYQLPWQLIAQDDGWGTDVDDGVPRTGQQSPARLPGEGGGAAIEVCPSVVLMSEAFCGSKEPVVSGLAFSHDSACLFATGNGRQLKMWRMHATVSDEESRGTALLSCIPGAEFLSEHPLTAMGCSKNPQEEGGVVALGDESGRVTLLRPW